MSYLTALPLPSPSHLIGLILVKLVAISVALALEETAGRQIIPIIGVIYAILLPLALFWLAP